jgi:polyisoprenoid-binding protein YceI
MIAKVTGRFRTFSGTIHVEPDPEQSWAEVTVDAASIDTGDPQRDGHLRSADFLDAERFPTIEFRSTGLRREHGKAFDVTGDLTMHGVTRSVTVACEYQGLATDPWGNQRLALTAHTEIDRGEWGLTWNQALETGGVLVGSQVTIQAEIQAIPERGRPEKP